MMFSEQDILLAYLAGFFDGEGSISATFTNFIKYPNHNPNIRVDVTNTDPKPIMLFQHNFGGYVRIRDQRGIGTKTLYCWALAGKRCIYFLESIIPYLIIKNHKAKIALKIIKLAKNRGIKGHENMEVAKALVEEMKNLSEEPIL